MDTKTDGIEANLKRINGLLQWWGMSTIPGIVPADAELSRHDPDVPPWDSLSAEEKKLFETSMEFC